MNPLTIEIRKLTIEYYDEMLRVWGDSGLDYRPFGRDQRDKIALEMKRPDTAFLGLFANAQLVGTALASYDGRKGWINRLAVLPDKRRRGFAGTLIKACEEFLESRGAKIIAILIVEYNTPSIELFQKHDYAIGEGVYYFTKRKSDET